MANEEQLAILRQGVDVWNAWQLAQHDPIDLSGADLRRLTLDGVNFAHADLHGADLSDTHLIDANMKAADCSGATFERTLMRGADLNSTNFTDARMRNAVLSRGRIIETNFTNAQLNSASFAETVLIRPNFEGADLSYARFVGSELAGVDLNHAKLLGANFISANLMNANLQGADLLSANLTSANVSAANLRDATLSLASIVNTNLQNADLSNSSIYGVSAWDVNLDGAIQTNLNISKQPSMIIRVDNLEVAQFIYLLLHNEKLRDVIDTVGKKAVLILGRFTDERKAVLDAIRDELRKRDYIPILFDFEKPSSRDVTETVSTLAHMARFVIADLTDAKSIPQELAQIVPHLPSVAVQPLILQGQREYGMFEHWQRYAWVLPIHQYETQAGLIAELGEKVIAPAEAKVDELRPKAR